MNKNIYFLSLIILLAAAESFAQSYYFGIKTGYGFYSMKNMKDFQNEISSPEHWEGIQFKTVDAFPAYINFQIQALDKIGEQDYAGGFIGYYSTGGRTAVSDYSGEIHLDQKLKAYAIGIVFDKSFYHNFYFTMQVSVLFTKMTVEESVKAYSQKVFQSSGFSSFGYAYEPGIFYQFLFNNMNIRAGIGYNFNSSNQFTSTENSNEILNNNPSWTGARIALSIGYEL